MLEGGVCSENLFRDAQFEDGKLKLTELNTEGKEITEEEIIAKHKAYRTYEVEDLEKSIEHIQKDIDELTNGAHKLLGNVNVAGEAVNMMINLLNRDLKIVTAMATIQGCLKSLGEKIAADKEGEKK